MQMKRTNIQQIEGAANLEVIKYTCPVCGYSKKIVDTHDKKNVSQAVYDAANALE
jgi:hypothetical protein